MPSHKKPTPEELDEQIKKAVDEVDETEEQEDDTVEGDDQEKEMLDRYQEKEDEKEDKEKPQEDKPPEKPEKKEVDYKKRYKDSSREGHRLYSIVQNSKNKKLSEVIEKAGEIPEPTADELTKEYPEWDEMSDFEQKMAKQNYVNTRRFEAISEATRDFKEIDQWNERVDKFITDPAILADRPELEGKEEDFKEFALDDSRRNGNLNDIVNSFLYEKSQEKPKVTRSQMMETGSSGRSDKGTEPGKISVDEAEALRKNNYKKYLDYVKKNRIDYGEL